MKKLRCERVVTPDGVRTDAVLELDDDRIIAITPATVTDDDAERVDGWVLPGYVDTHVHGGGGAAYPTTDQDEIRTARAFHARNGTTTSFASLVTRAPEVLLAQLAALVPLARDGLFAGIHLEGPFLSRDKCGAHDPDLLINPETSIVDQLLKAGDGQISMITMAPELEGGLAAMERLTRAGIQAAFGHSDADHDQVGQAVAAGARVVTHLFNAMRPIHHRDPGPIPRLLATSSIMVELICDGIHLDPAVIAMAINAVGPDRVALITDAIAAAGLPDGPSELGAFKTMVTDGAVRLVREDGSLGSIAGSTLTMADAVRFVVEHGVSIPDAARMAATTPARRYGLEQVGQLSVGRRADLCLVDDQARLIRVMHGGQWSNEEPSWRGK